MEYRYLGRSGLRVSALTMGTMTFGGGGAFAKVGASGLTEASRQIDMCLDAGVNLLDTANIYSLGLSEEIIGDALAGGHPDLLIASKLRMRVGDGPNDQGLSRWHILREVERSLKRLRRDTIDILYLHAWDGSTPLEETLGALHTLVEQGKVRYVGCSNFSGWHVMKALNLAERGGFPRFVTQQIHYTLEAREAEYELLPISVDQGLGALIWSPLAGGLLSGKYGPDQESARQAAGWSEPPIRDVNRLWEIVAALRDIGAAQGVSAAQVALAWLLGRPGVASLVIGGRSEAQFADSLAAVNLVLSAEDRSRLDAVSRPPVLYPYWHQYMTARARFGPADRIIDHGAA